MIKIKSYFNNLFYLLTYNFRLKRTLKNAVWSESEYDKTILNNVDKKPKTIFQLMKNTKICCWSSVPAMNSILWLVERGLLTEIKTSWHFDQERLFISAGSN